MSNFENLNERIINLLSDYEVENGRRYEPTRYGVQAIINEWEVMKAPLIAGWQRHPAYDGDGKIVLSEKMYRSIDHKAVARFGEWVASVAPFASLYKVGDEVEILDGSDIEDYAGNWVKEMGAFVGKTMKVSEVGRAFGGEYYRLDGDWHMYDGRGLKSTEERPQDMLPYMDNKQREFFIHTLKDCSQFIKASEELDEEGKPIIVINRIFPFVKAHNGQKTSRVINKICKYFGIDKNPEYNAKFTEFADAINPLAITRWTILSINPIDFLTMSFGHGWASCHTIDKTNRRRTNGRNYEGCYSGGTLSYMLDGTSFVMYTVDGSYTGKNYELQDKIQRQMFHYGNEKLIQGRLYPMDQEGNENQGTTECMEMYDQFRAIAQRVISECFELNNFWTNVKGTNECCRVTYSHGVHYRDYECYSNCNVSYLKREDGTKNKEPISIGADPICPECGSRHDRQECIVCCDCTDDGYTCDNCGEHISRDSYDMLTIDGNVFCDSECAERYGYRYCENDGEWHHIDSGDVYFDENLDEYFYDDRGDHIETADGYHFIDSDSAMDAGYTCTDDGEWYPDDDVFYCEECNSYVHRDCWNFELEMCESCASDRREEEGETA